MNVNFMKYTLRIIQLIPLIERYSGIFIRKIIVFNM